NPTAVLTNDKKGSVKVSDGRQIFQLPIQNNVPSYIGNMSLKAKVTYKSTGDTVLTDSQKNRSVAPNSSFTYQIPSERVMKAGKYHYVVTMTNDKTKKSWTFSDDFTVSRASATSVGIGRSIAFVPTWIWQLLALFLVLIGFLFFLLWKRRKDEDDEDEANAK
ncbi:MAG: WxL protein host-binding domain-containing protein, partial [Weissella cibaria]